MKKYQQTIGTGVVILIGLLFATFYQGDLNLGKAIQKQRSGETSKTSPKKEIPADKKAGPSKELSEKESAPKTKNTMTKEDKEKGPVLVKGPKGEEDISGTLSRIERGEKFPHRNDGGVFRNREKRLPLENRGYYHEFVHPTQGRKGPGAQRIVIGSEKEIYYTPDHYETFQRVKK